MFRSYLECDVFFAGHQASSLGFPPVVFLNADVVQTTPLFCYADPCDHGAQKREMHVPEAT